MATEPKGASTPLAVEGDAGWGDRARQVIGMTSAIHRDDEEVLPLEDVLEEEFQFLHAGGVGPLASAPAGDAARWAFLSDHVLDPDRLKATLYALEVSDDSESTDPAYARARGRALDALIAASTKAAIWSGEGELEVATAAIARDLNVLLGVELASLPEFLALPVPGPVRAAMERPGGAVTPEGMARLNRRLLEIVFPTELYRIRDVRLERLYAKVRDEKHAALCLSGGGIRSATFSLGVIQGLARRHVLERFDYLSTVSGGGYLGAWLTAWMARAGRSRATRDLTAMIASKVDGETAPLRHLRTYSNFLNPRVGLLSGDTWTLIATYLRNVLLTWVILVPLLAAVALVPYIALAVVRSQPAHWGVSRASFLPGVLAIAALVLGAYGISFVYQNRPKGDPAPSDVRKMFLDRAQGAFLVHCFAPLVGSAVLLTTAWIWMTNWTRFRPGVWAFLAFGAAMHFFGYVIARWREWSWRNAVPIALSGVVAGGLGYVATVVLIAAGATLTGSRWLDPLYVTFATPTFLAIVFVGGSVYAGLNGRRSSDAAREWSARFNAWILIAIVGWTVASSLILLVLPRIADRTGAAAGVGSFTALSGLLAAKLGFTGPKGPQKGEDSPTAKGAMAAIRAAVRAKGLVVLAVIAVLGFIVLLSALDAALLGLACRSIESACVAPPASAATATPIAPGTPIAAPTPGAAETPGLDATARLYAYGGEDPRWIIVLALSVALALVGAFMGWIIDTNRFSLHAMYRARLTRAYLGASRPAPGRAPDPFTGFDEDDDRYMHEMRIAESRSGPERPLLHVVNIALNLVGGSNLAWQERRADSFTVTSLHAGSHRLGYRRTSAAPGAEPFSRKQRAEATSPRPYIYGGRNGISLGTAITISGAAASPNMGYHSSPAVTFLMTLLNVRLGWWLGNPGPAGDTTYGLESPRFGLRPILAEMFGQTNDRNAYVYLSDGGHFENLGLYEMVLRRCRCIFVVDASCDQLGTLNDLGNAIRKIRVDLGVPIVFTSGFPPDPQEAFHEGAPLTNYCAIGDIQYSLVDRLREGDTEGDGDGKLIYIKPALGAHIPKDVFTYSKGSDAFPHESTIDQFFSESQFESYRALGRDIVDSIFKDDKLKNEIARFLDDEPPTISSTVPAANLVNVPRTCTLTVVFSESIAPSSATTKSFIVSPEGGTPIAGTVTVDGEVVTFAPAAPLAYLTLYTATLTRGIRDLAGNALAVPLSWTFTTESPPSPTFTAITSASSATTVPLTPP